jgi:hypothetical protein
MLGRHSVDSWTIGLTYSVVKFMPAAARIRIWFGLQSNVDVHMTTAMQRQV